MSHKHEPVEDPKDSGHYVCAHEWCRIEWWDAIEVELKVMDAYEMGKLDERSGVVPLSYEKRK